MTELSGSPQSRMLLEVNESSVTFLLESSSVSQQFLKFSCEQLISLLHHRATDGRSDSFSFNVGHFCKEYSFWADQAVQCSLSAATNAADWIRSWQVGSFYTTPRGEPISSRLGPHTLPPLITALNDPFVQAVHLLTCSSPYEGSNDLLSHIRYASKGRPVHVTFLTGQKAVDYKAMEILHLISKETGGQFKVAYFNGDGILLEVLRGTSKNFPTRDVDVCHNSVDFLNDMQFRSDLHRSSNHNDFSNSRNGQFLQLYNNQRGLTTTIGDELQLKKSQTFGDLKIPLKSHRGGFEGTNDPEASCYHLNSSKHYHFEGLNQSSPDLSDFLKMSHRLNAEGQILTEMNEDKMEEIKQMFAKFYLEKSQHTKAVKSPKFKALKGKTFKFPTDEESHHHHHHKHHSKKSSRRKKSGRKSSRRRSASTTSTSSSSDSRSSSGDEEKKSRLKALQNWTPPTPFIYPTHLVQNGGVWDRLHRGEPVLSSRPKTATRPTTARPTTAASDSSKRIWRPPTRPSSGFITQGLRNTVSSTNTTTVKNERTLWQDKFWNNCVAKEAKFANRTAIPPPPGPPPPPLRRIQRPTLNNPNFSVGHQHHHNYSRSGLGPPEVETIRELVKQNGVLVHALEKTAVPLSHRSYDQVNPTAVNRPHYPFNQHKPTANSFRTEPNRERREWREMAKVFDAKKSINEEIKNLSQVGLVNRHVPLGADVPPAPSNRSLGHNYEAMKKTRDQLVAEQFQRKEEIQRQRSQTNYKQMYDRLTNNNTQHNNTQSNGFIAGEGPIAHYPT